VGRNRIRPRHDGASLQTLMAQQKKITRETARFSRKHQKRGKKGVFRARGSNQGGRGGKNRREVGGRGRRGETMVLPKNGVKVKQRMDRF